MRDAPGDHPGAMPMAGAAGGDMASMDGSPHGLHVGSAVDALYRPLVDEVLLSGRPHAGTEPHRPDRELVFFVPVDLGGERHVFEVAKDSAILDEQVSDVRRVLVATLGLGLPFGLLLFYGIGGRALTARHRTAERRSSRDHLTGLGNHRSFQEELRREVGLGRRHGEPLTLALIDIDDFKLVNDEHGHRRGDAVLAQVANVLQTGRPEDRAYRVGGDEFAMLLHQTDLEGANVLAERIRTKVVGLGLGVTTSIGLAQLGHPALDAEDLFESADAALYQAKAAGRNRVAWHEHPAGDEDPPATAGSARVGSEHQGSN